MSFRIPNMFLAHAAAGLCAKTRHSGARPKAASPEPIFQRPVFMGSGLAAVRRPGMTRRFCGRRAKPADWKWTVEYHCVNRHSRESGNPGEASKFSRPWIPAFAGMTRKWIYSEGSGLMPLQVAWRILVDQKGRTALATGGIFIAILLIFVELGFFV